MIITNLLAAVLKIADKSFLETLKFCDLQGQTFARALQVLRALGQVLAPFNSGGRCSKGTLKHTSE
jgi:hypothetical protein